MTTTFGSAAALVVAPLGVEVLPGSSLLAGIRSGPGLASHRALRGPLPHVSTSHLVGTVEQAALGGRGGAGFPFAEKLRAVQRARRPPVVVNACEGEPLSAKDSVLAVLAPHLVLDGAVLAARVLGSRTVHVVVPGDRPIVQESIGRAVRERDAREDGVKFDVHLARPGFVSGQARAVLELIEGRENLPVTGLRPATLEGLRGRPTLLSNAETFAHVAALMLRPASADIPASAGQTTLLTVDDEERRRVLEVQLGTPWRDVLDPVALRGPVLVGGFHGRWAPQGALETMTVSHVDMQRRGLTLGAGVTFVPRGCPVVATARIAAYLAGETAGRCGPCLNGLPALAGLVSDLADGRGDRSEVVRIARLVTGRGSCAHPDGTAAMVASAVLALDDEFGRHALGDCSWDGRHRDER
ncbi:MAG: hypothetical protein QOD98_4329 [Nocardioidaceae bacterium]|nr:hypothetical protein [Nocardioidaceae bacterium]